MRKRASKINREAMLAAREARPKEYSDEALHLFKVINAVVNDKPKYCPELCDAVLFLETKYHADAMDIAKQKLTEEEHDGRGH